MLFLKSMKKTGQLVIRRIEETEKAPVPVKVRPDLNLEKWTIWQPSQARTELKARIIDREINLPNGDKATAQVKIVPSTEGALTTFDQRVFYALIKIWEEKGKSITYTHLSLKRLAKTLGIKWGTKTIQALTNSIERLRMTHFCWEHSYYNAETRETVEVMENPFTILSERKIVKTKRDGHITREEGYFRFHPLIVANLHANYTKPVLFDVVMSFKSEIAQIIYTQVDLFLASKARYERRTKELFEDLGLEGTAYRYVSKRKQMLEPALKELEGKPLSSGGILKATLEPCKTVSDFKVIFEKRSGKGKKEPAAKEGATALVEVTTPAPAKLEALTKDEETLLAALCDYGIKESKAITLIKTQREATARQLAAFPYRDPSEKKNPAGLLITAIEKDYDLPEGYHIAEKDRDAKEKAAARQRAEEGKRQEERQYQEAVTRARKAFDALPKAQREALLEARKLEIAKEPTWAVSLAANNPNTRAIILNSLVSAARDSILDDVARGNLEF